MLDTSVLVPAATSPHPGSINAKVVRAGVLGIYECVLSTYIQEETRETLQEPDFSLAIGEIDAKLAPLWSIARFLPPVPFDDPQLLKVVQGDRDDLPVFATGLAIFADPLIAAGTEKFLVSNNSSDFTPGWKPFGIHFVTARQFWDLLERGKKAKLP